LLLGCQQPHSVVILNVDSFGLYGDLTATAANLSALRELTVLVR
jgi:hypothetical protein